MKCATIWDCGVCYEWPSYRKIQATKEEEMKSGKLTFLTLALFVAGTSAASAASATASGSAALALAGVIAPYSSLTYVEKNAVAAFFAGRTNVSFARKITVTADK